jgi:hypothetical protein
MIHNSTLGVRSFVIQNWVPVVGSGKGSWEVIGAFVQGDIDFTNILEYCHAEPAGVGVLFILRGVNELVPQAAEIMLELG